MATLTTEQQANIKTIVAEFNINKTDDYSRMEAELRALGLKPDNKFIWACINANAKQVESYDTDFLS